MNSPAVGPCSCYIQPSAHKSLNWCPSFWIHCLLEKVQTFHEDCENFILFYLVWDPLRRSLPVAQHVKHVILPVTSQHLGGGSNVGSIFKKVWFLYIEYVWKFKFWIGIFLLYICSWRWTQPFWNKSLLQLGLFPKFLDEHETKNYLTPPHCTLQVSHEKTKPLTLSLSMILVVFLKASIERQTVIPT